MDIFFCILLLIVAFLYASVGHGGASGYLALMFLFELAPDTTKPVALLLNVFVSLVSFIQYYRKNYFQWNLFWPFAITSIPAAFLGGFVTIDAAICKKILGIFLFFPIIRLLGFIKETSITNKDINFSLALLIGATIGLFSGMIGIGGGIILSPVILLLGWANMKQSAAISALFIFVNSLAGLFGIFSKGFTYTHTMTTMLIIALIGGGLGAYYGANKTEDIQLKKILAIVLLIAAVKLIIT